MNRPDAKRIAETITNEQLLQMFNSAKENITDWTKTSNVNKGMTKGAAWNILAKDFDVSNKYHNLAKVNYPFAKDKWASRFTATCLLFRRVRSLTVAPHVYSQVPYEVLMSCTDNANIQLLI